MALNDPGLSAIKAISDTFKQTYDTQEAAEWRGHSLEWIRNQSSARIGKIGRLLAMGLCEKSNFPVRSVGYSLVVNGKTIQVRFSTGWSGGGFKFEQLRDENFKGVFCIGITPQRAYAWVIPKTLIFDAKGRTLKKPGLPPNIKEKLAPTPRGLR